MNATCKYAFNTDALYMQQFTLVPNGSQITRVVGFGMQIMLWAAAEVRIIWRV